jgi:putative Mg2+ transporter-C (MgtC) family protein
VQNQAKFAIAAALLAIIILSTAIYTPSVYSNIRYTNVSSGVLDLALVVLAGFLIGGERESRGKPAGITTHCFVIGGSAIFSFMSGHVYPNSPHVDPSRIAAGLVTGIGFLGAGVILKSRTDERITNLATAASIWYAAAIGMAIGFNFYVIAVVAISFAVLVPRMPHISKSKDEDL